jgi:hypothetical protein
LCPAADFTGDRFDRAIGGRATSIGRSRCGAMVRSRQSRIAGEGELDCLADEGLGFAIEQQLGRWRGRVNRATRSAGRIVGALL